MKPRASWEKKRCILILLTDGSCIALCIRKADVKESYNEILSKLKCDIILCNYWYTCIIYNVHFYLLLHQ